jgi:uncharacterized protein (DUF302 family)
VKGTARQVARIERDVHYFALRRVELSVDESPPRIVFDPVFDDPMILMKLGARRGDCRGLGIALRWGRQHRSRSKKEVAMSDEYAFRGWIDAPYSEALARVKEALKTEGFGVLTEADMKSTFAEKLGVEFRAYAILGACNPPLSHRALSQELDAGLVLPCNVVVYEDAEGTQVVIADPQIVVQTLDKPGLESIAREARAKLERVAVALRG